MESLYCTDLGPTEIDYFGEENLAVFYALQLTSEVLTPADEEYVSAYEQAQPFCTSRIPGAVILGRGAEGAQQAVEGLLDVVYVIDPDWKTFKCIRVNGPAENATCAKHSTNKHVTRFPESANRRFCRATHVATPKTMT